MRAVISLFVLTLIANPLGLRAQGVGPLAQELLAKTGYNADAHFEVLLPSAQDPVTYDITLQSDAEAADSLSPCQYLIRWQSTSPRGVVKGFSAYFDGNHYRFRNNRLQEYHFQEMPEVFGNKERASHGVQREAQFADLLPQFVGEKLMEMEVDSTFKFILHPDTIVQGRRCVAIDGLKETAGYESMNFLYAFDYATHLPTYFDIETSPGSISEQLITVTYEPTASLSPIALSEDALIENWPEEFQNYRESNFRTENLVGNPLPDFSCRRVAGTERMSHQRGQELQKPTIIAILNPEVSSAKATVEALREGVAQLPYTADLIFAFATGHDEDIAEVVGESTPDEIVLLSAGSLIRNCGITLFPTIIMADTAGNVKYVHTGYNKNLAEIVVEEASLLK